MADTIENTHTPYGVSKMANKRLVAEGLPKIPSQMLYSYVTNKLIPHVVVGDQKRVTDEDARAWIDKYVSNLKRRAAEAAAESVEDEAAESVDA